MNKACGGASGAFFARKITPFKGALYLELGGNLVLHLPCGRAHIAYFSGAYYPCWGPSEGYFTP